MILERFLVFLARVFNGDKRLFKFIPENTKFPLNSIRTVKRNGIHYQLDISDYQQWLIYFYCKTDSSDHVLDYIDNSLVIIDIGANIGQTALNMLRSQKQKQLNPIIYAFEPFPPTFEKLRKNIELNDLNENIRCINKGLSAESGVLPMIKPYEANSGGFRIARESNSETVKVEVTTLDNFVQENGINQIDFIKIDVEGFEFEVLKGMQQVLETHKPVVIFEFDTQNLADLNINPQDIFIYLQNLNYSFKDVNGLINFGDVAKFMGHTDIICFPSGITNE